MKNPILIAALAFAATGAAMLATPASAQPPAGATVAVSYADLDLTTPAGIRTLDRRILSAVRQACGPTSDFDPAGRNLVEACRSDALERLSAQRETAIAAANQPQPVLLAAQR